MSAVVVSVLSLEVVPTISHWGFSVTATTTLSLLFGSSPVINHRIGLRREIVPLIVLVILGALLLKSILFGKTSLSILKPVIFSVEAALMLPVERLTLVFVVVIVTLVLNLVVLLSVILSLSLLWSIHSVLPLVILLLLFHA